VTISWLNPMAPRMPATTMPAAYTHIQTVFMLELPVSFRADLFAGISKYSSRRKGFDDAGSNTSLRSELHAAGATAPGCRDVLRAIRERRSCRLYNSFVGGW